MIIAIDGPAASGKTSTAKKLAEKLSYTHLNSGLMYRALTYVFLIENCINDFSKNLNILLKKIKFTGKNLNTVYYNNENITDYLYSEQINSNIKFISNNKKIRKNLILLQRKLVENKNVVCEGRDIGSVVFPNAEFKFYLEADINVRALRRYKQLKNDLSIDEIKKNIVSRDFNDKNRNISPLIKTSDCIIVDTTEMTITKQVEYLYSTIINQDKK